MLETDFIETRTYKLTALSPLHIKGHEVEYGIGMIKQGDYAYIIDQDKLNSFILENALTDKFVETYSNQESFETNLLDKFFQDNGISFTPAILKTISSRKVPRFDSSKFIRNGNGQVFIPGSSIKGALRTALAFQALKIEKGKTSTLWTAALKEVDDNILAFSAARDNREKEKLKATFAKNLMAEIFGAEPYQDLFRAIKVTDAVITSGTPEERRVKVLCFSTTHSNNAYFSHNIQISLERLPRGTVATFKIHLDKHILKERLASNKIIASIRGVDFVSWLLVVASSFARQQWTEEKTLLSKRYGGVDLTDLRKFYDGEILPNLRLGWGTGMLGMTIDMLFEQELRNRIRDMSQPRDDAAPKSRRVVVNGEKPQYPLGWVQLAPAI